MDLLDSQPWILYQCFVQPHHHFQCFCLGWELLLRQCCSQVWCQRRHKPHVVLCIRQRHISLADRTFNLWSRSQGFSPRSIAISLNPIIDCISDFGLLNSLFNALWTSTILAFGWSFECLIYQVSARSYSALTNVAFLMLSSVTPCASHTALTTNQNWSGSLFPTPLNTGNLISFSMLNYTPARSSPLACGGEINPLIPLKLLLLAVLWENILRLHCSWQLCLSRIQW